MENKDRRQPGNVILFSGHMIDSPNRQTPRFPPDQELVAAKAIAATLEKLDVGRGDLCISGGASGGDILFAEAALDRGARLEVYIPFEEPTFLKKSVEFAGDDWQDRFFAIKSRATLHVLPLERHLAARANPYEQNNLWMLEAAERFGADKVDFVCLSNGLEGDGPGGAWHLMNEVRKNGGRAHWVDTTKLWG